MVVSTIVDRIIGMRARRNRQTVAEDAEILEKAPPPRVEPVEIREGNRRQKARAKGKQVPLFDRGDCPTTRARRSRAPVTRNFNSDL